LLKVVVKENHTPRYHQIFFASLLIVIAVLLQATDALDVYDTETLQKANEIYANKIRLVWEQDLLARLIVNERQAAGNDWKYLNSDGGYRSLERRPKCDTVIN